VRRGRERGKGRRGERGGGGILVVGMIEKTMSTNVSEIMKGDYYYQDYDHYY